jgi:hypothetical protein
MAQKGTDGHYPCTGTGIGSQIGLIQVGQMTGNAAHGAYIAIGDVMRWQAYIPAFSQAPCTVGGTLIKILWQPNEGE